MAAPGIQMVRVHRPENDPPFLWIAEYEVRRDDVLYEDVENATEPEDVIEDTEEPDEMPEDSEDQAVLEQAEDDEPEAEEAEADDEE